MPEGTTTIHCPYCGYPYPMSKLQLDVYIGRSMGCMHCGKSFPVSAPPPPDELLASAPRPSSSPTESVVTDEPVQGGSTTAESPAPPPYVTAPSPGIGAPAQRQPTEPPSVLAVLGFASAVLFVVLAMLAGVVGYAGSSENAIKAVSRSQTPLALLWTAFGFAAAAALLGAVALLQAHSKQPKSTPVKPRYAVATTALVLGLCELFIASLLALLVLPPLNRGLAESHRAVCQTNLQQIGYALISRASEEQQGRFPDSLADLVRDGRVKADLMVCPACEHAPAPDSKNTADQADLIAAGQHVAYKYVGKGLAMKASGGRRVSTLTVLAYEPPGLHGDPEAFHILFADGAVIYAEKGQASKILGELQSGQNPPPSAEMIKR